MNAVLRGSVIALAIRVSAAVVAYAGQVLLAQWLGVSGFGLVSFAVAWLTMLAVLAALGFPGANLRFVPVYVAADDWSRVRGLLSTSALIPLCAGVMMTIVGAVALHVFRDAIEFDYRLPLAIALVGVPVVALVSVNVETARGFGWIGLAYAPAQLGVPTLMLLSAFALFSTQGRLSASDAVLSLVLSFFVVLLYQSAAIARRCRSRLSGVLPRREIRPWLRVSVPLLFVDGLTLIGAQLDLIVVGVFVAPADVGVYAAAAKTAVLVIYVFEAANGLAASQIARMFSQGKRDDLQALLSGLVHWVFWPSLFILLLVVVMGKFILGFFGTQFVAAYPVLVVLALGNMALVSAGPVKTLLTMTGHQDDCLRVAAVALLVNVVLVAILTPIFGIMGAATGSAFSLAARHFWLHSLVRRRLGLRASLLSSKIN